jgi:outer membrane protein insertion porin family
MKLPKLTAVVLLLLAQVIPGPADADNPKEVTVESIKFHGNSALGDKRLRELMAVRTGGFLRHSFYNPQVFRDDLENIRKMYSDNGYLEAAIRDVAIDSTANRFHIDITISEGERTMVQEILFSGNKVFSGPQIRKDIRLKPGKPLRSRWVGNTVGIIMSKYGRKGYINVQVSQDIRVNHDSHRAIIEFTIIEEQQYTISAVNIQGLIKTRKTVVERELRFRKDQIIDISEILRSEQNLYGTGLFNSVLIQPRPVPGDSAKRSVEVDVRERKSGELSGGLGYQTVDGFRGTLAVQNNNLLGTGRKVGCVSQISQISRNGRISLINPWTLGIHVRSEAGSLVEYREEPGYDLRSLGGNIVLGKTLRSHTDAAVIYRFESIKISHIQSAEIPVKQEKGNLRSLTVSATYDNRDDIFNPRKGSFVESRSSLVGSFLGGTDSYLTASLTGRSFYPATRRITVGTALQFGWQGMFRTTREIPLSERLYTGGPTTLRGFEYQKVGPLDEKGVPLGGRLLVTGNLEFRATVYRILEWAVFLDAGNVWSNTGDFRFKDIRTDVGFGPRINTPVGAVRADFAFKLDRKRGERLNQFYFAFGQAF